MAGEMWVEKCNRCKSKTLYLMEKKDKNGEIMTALRCKKCNKWLKWVNDEDKLFYTLVKKFKLFKA